MEFYRFIEAPNASVAAKIDFVPTASMASLDLTNWSLQIFIFVSFPT